MSDMQIEILGRNDYNTIKDKKYPDLREAASHLKPTGGPLASKNVRIMIRPPASSLIFESIGWGSKYKLGDVEQAGILIGKYHKDRSTCEQVIWADVVTVIPADPTLVNASSERIEITVDAWKQMYDDAEKYLVANFQILGWYHTHLGNISTRFSGVDARTQRKAFTYKYSFGIVFNPNQEKWSAFYGPDSRGCVGDLIYDDVSQTRHRKPKITIWQVNGDSELKDGSVVHYVENNQIIEVHPAETEAVSPSFGQLAGEILVGAGRLVINPLKRHDSRGSTDGNDSRLPTRQIQDEMTSRASTAAVRYFTMTPANKFIEHPNVKCSINEKDIDDIIKHRQICISQNKYLWANITQSNYEMELTLVDEQHANAKVVYASINASPEIDETLAIGFQLSSGEKIKFVVLVESASTLSIDIRVIRFSRENVYG